MHAYLKVFEDVENDKSERLEESEKIDAVWSDAPQVRSIRLMLQRHEHDQNALKKLETAQRGDAHEKENAIEDGHRHHLMERERVGLMKKGIKTDDKDN